MLLLLSWRGLMKVRWLSLSPSLSLFLLISSLVRTGCLSCFWLNLNYNPCKIKFLSSGLSSLSVCIICLYLYSYGVCCYHSNITRDPVQVRGDNNCLLRDSAWMHITMFLLIFFAVACSSAWLSLLAWLVVFILVGIPGRWKCLDTNLKEIQ